jgi:hypothetical protein
MGPKRRKTMSAPMSAIEGISGLVALGHDPTLVTLAVRKRLVGAISEDPLTQIERIELNTPPDRCG